MRVGQHYAEVTVLCEGFGYPFFGVISADLRQQERLQAQATQTLEGTGGGGALSFLIDHIGWGDYLAFSDSAWSYYTANGELAHAGDSAAWGGGRPARQGDVVGLLLDLAAPDAVSSLSVYLNGERLGVMVEPGRVDYTGETGRPLVIAPLSTPLYWAVAMGSGGSVRIERKPVPMPTPPSPVSTETSSRLASS
jgi:hypothetical protein